MYKYLILLVVSLSAFALPRPDRTVELDYCWKSLRPGLMHGRQCDLRVALMMSGDAYRIDEGSVIESTGQKLFAIAKFDRARMAEIRKLVEEAKTGEIEHRQSFCLAIPDESVGYTAKRYNTLLYSASEPCGGAMKNKSPAAEELVEILNELVELAKKDARLNDY